MKKIIFSLLVCSGILYSCEDFLEEEMVATLTQDHYNTESGIEDLVNGAYEGLRFHHSYEWSYVLTNYGTDEFTNGGGTDHVIWNTYVAQLDPTETRNLAPLWDNMYAQINTANIGIEKIPDVLAGNLNQNIKNTRLGEMYFLRAFAYFKLVEQFGGVPLSLQPIKADLADFPRASAEEVYQVIISDLRKAAEILPDAAAQTGRIAKSAARHFLAKAYLFRASELNASFSKQNDLDSAAHFAELVINDPRHKLATNYHDLFNYTAVNGPNETNAEIILASQFENTQALLGRFGNQTHLYFLSVYRDLPGMTRDVENGREFQRLRPTDYAIDIYDRKNDSRFYKSFKTVYKANNSRSLPKWPSGQLKFNVGDTSIIYVVNSTGDNRFTPAYKNSFAPTLLVRNSLADNGAAASDWTISRYLTLNKYLDPFRTNFNDVRGTRDGILARLGETYLIAAEAWGRKGDYARALTYINALRQRAAYKDGEFRPGSYYLSEQVKWGEKTSTADKMQITEAAFTAGTPQAAAELYPNGVSSKKDMFIHFILNERARELMGEFHRWGDLSRTKTLIQRANAFNSEAAANIQEKHLYRPIPQEYIDGVRLNGKSLSAQEKTALQNPGY